MMLDLIKNFLLYLVIILITISILPLTTTYFTQQIGSMVLNLI
ncbi:hypothetical protein ESA_01186 [Cronobacter sakazakii ATCC BAA-894]|uniref:Uncharacterized protein n=1 Tax=Cronobacter sakazakii (strain ATCC BAA-894) TaxID=290339 RepID=A7MHD5_CROS8|nr:hypothetical protein ESA_01186 [Cronobacter sakazakii ATCC BAA-894]